MKIRFTTVLCLFLLWSVGHGQDSEAPADLEFSGVANLGDKTLFSIRFPKEDRAFWAELNRLRSGVKVTAYDPANNEVEVEYEGRSFRLALKKADEQAFGIAWSRTTTINGVQGEERRSDQRIQRRPARRKNAPKAVARSEHYSNKQESARTVSATLQGQATTGSEQSSPNESEAVAPASGSDSGFRERTIVIVDEEALNKSTRRRGLPNITPTPEQAP